MGGREDREPKCCHMLNMLSCRMCEGEKRKLVIPSELGKRSFLSGYRVPGMFGKDEGWFSLCIGLPHPLITVHASSKFSCVQQCQGKTLEALSSDVHLVPFIWPLQPPLTHYTPIPGCYRDGQKPGFSLGVCRTSV